MTHFVYCTNARIPTEKAHGKQIMEMCSAFVNTGARLTLLLPRRNNPMKEDPFEYYSVSKNFSIAFLWCIDGLSFPFFKQIMFVLQTLTFVVRSFFTLVFLPSTSIVYTRDLGIACLSFFLRAPLAYEVHVPPSKKSYRHTFALRHARWVVCISGGVRDALRDYGVPFSKMCVAHDGVNLSHSMQSVSKSEARQRLNLNLEQKMIVYTGHLYVWKGVHTLVQASSLLDSTTHIWLIGGTNEEVQELKKNYSDVKNLHIVGHRPPHEIPLWTKVADVLVLPNSGKSKISSLYTSPLKLFEYMASGSPMVCADLPSIREIVDESEVTFFTPDSSQDLYRAITESLSLRDDEKKERASRVYTKVTQYTWDCRAERIIHHIYGT